MAHSVEQPPYLLSRMGQGVVSSNVKFIIILKRISSSEIERVCLSNRNFLRKHHVCMQEDAKVCLDQYYWLN